LSTGRSGIRGGEINETGERGPWDGLTVSDPLDGRVVEEPEVGRGAVEVRARSRQALAVGAFEFDHFGRGRSGAGHEVRPAAGACEGVPINGPRFVVGLLAHEPGQPGTEVVR